MSRQAGLTLIEVLASLALLTLLASVSLPLLRDISAAASRTVDLTGREELADLAAQLLEAPEELGFDEGIPAEARIPWGDHARMVRMLSLPIREMSPARWLILESGGDQVIRWYLPDEPAEDEQDGEEDR
jgi:prepilin-type N-terminal cleavage/methylation domain-containing protein